MNGNGDPDGDPWLTVSQTALERGARERDVRWQGWRSIVIWIDHPIPSITKVSHRRADCATLSTQFQRNPTQTLTADRYLERKALYGLTIFLEEFQDLEKDWVRMLVLVGS